MEKFYKKTFLSWDEKGTVVSRVGEKSVLVEDATRAIALCDGTWFYRAINTLRDGDMGEKDENGVYERTWYGDDIFNADVDNVRPATISEVKLYLKYCKLEDEANDDGREVVAIVYDHDQTDVIFRDIE